MIPPAGTVTFLFTDIEGSTNMWDAHPETMQLSLARHDDSLRYAITPTNGYIFKTIGVEGRSLTLEQAIALALESVPVR